MIFFLIGKGGSGKDTILQELLKQFSLQDRDVGNELKQLVTYTTRPMREGEKDGVEYHFVDIKTLKKMNRQKKILELRKYRVATGDKWYYFTADDGQINELNDLILVGPLKQYTELNKRLTTPIIPIYIKVDDSVIKKRMYKRESKQENPNYDEVDRRIEADRKDFKNIKDIEGLVEVDNNGSLSSTVLHLTNIITNMTNSYYMLKAEVLGIRKTESQSVTEFTECSEGSINIFEKDTIDK